MAESHQTAQPILPSNVDDPRFVALPEDVTPTEWTASDALLAGVGDPVEAFKNTVRSDTSWGVGTLLLSVVARFVYLVRKILGL
jgi:hypothetical protein